MTHTEKALAVIQNDHVAKELKKIRVESQRCAHHKFEGRGTPVCLGKPAFKSCGSWFCAEHAEDYMQDDLRMVLELCKGIKEGLCRIRAGHSSHKKTPKIPKIKKLCKVASDMARIYNAK